MHANLPGCGRSPNLSGSDLYLLPLFSQRYLWTPRAVGRVAVLFDGAIRYLVTNQTLECKFRPPRRFCAKILLIRANRASLPVLPTTRSISNTLICLFECTEGVGLARPACWVCDHNYITSFEVHSLYRKWLKVSRWW